MAGTPTAEILKTNTPGVNPGLLTTVTPVPELTIWMPPEFGANNSTTAGSLLARRMEEFSKLNGGVKIQVRIKASNGVGGLLDSLTTASAAAPSALPSLIALPRSDLEVAALKGLIYPLDGSSTAIDEGDWFNYAKQLAMVEGGTFALPFAGDALIIAYRPGQISGSFSDWSSLFRLGQPLAFSAGDAQAMFVLSMYQSIGGPVEDAQHRPTLQPDLLSQVLGLISDGEKQGVFPYWLSQYETDGQIWQAYQDRRVNALVTWTSQYLSTLPPDTAAVPIPALTDTPSTLATGWGWAVADPDPNQRLLSTRLAEYLTEGKFLSEWSEAAGYLPTRPSALADWSNQNLKTFLSPVAVSAHLRPTGDQLSSLGPILKDAALKVMKRESDPTQAAKEASEKLSFPENK